MWAKTGEEPSTLENKPELTGPMIEYYKAFRTLSTRRPPSGMGGISPIPLSDMKVYIEMFETDDMETFVSVVSAADVALINHVSKTRKQAEKTDKKDG